MKIRRIFEKDIPEILSMMQAYRREQQKKMSRKDLEAASEQLKVLCQSRPACCWVAANPKDKAVGFINCHLLPFPLVYGSELYISDLFVAENARGNGTGSALIAFAREFALSQGCARIMLNNLKTDQSYIRGFYVSQGFTERDTIANMVMMLEPTR